MQRLFFTVMILAQCLFSSASAAVLVLDLADDINADMLTTSEYFLDKSSNISASSIVTLPPSSWKRFNRDQLRLGFTSNPVWIRTRFKTIGDQSRDITFGFHKALSNITMQVAKEGSPSLPYIFNKRIQKDTQMRSHLNTSNVFLEPNNTYELLVRINSTSPVIGEFIAAEAASLKYESTQINQWVMTAMILIFLASIYNAIVFLSSRHPAVIAHLVYVLSILGFLINDFGYLEKWTEIAKLETTQRISAVFLISAILSLIAFFQSMGKHQKYKQLFHRLYQCLFLAGYTLISVMFFLPFQHVLNLMLLLIGISATVCLARALTTWQEKSSRVELNNPLSLTLIIVFSTLVPSVVIQILSRRGIIDVAWYTEYILFASIILEVILISAALFFNIRKGNDAYEHEVYTDNLSGLPNYRALEKYFAQQSYPKNKTMIQVWISGLDQLQVAFGPDLYKKFLSAAAEQMNQALLNMPVVIKHSDHNQQSLVSIFHTDKNTFTLFCSKLGQQSPQDINQRLTRALETIAHIHHNSIDLNIVLGAFEFEHNKVDLNSALANCNLALAYGIKHDKPFKLYTAQMSFEERQRQTLVNDFPESLANGEIFLLWQPQYDSQTSKIIGAEVLSRWEHHQYGLISPEVFIPLLEQSTRICDLSHWIINEVLKQLPSLQERHPGIEISINLSPRDLFNNGLIEFLDQKRQTHAQLIPFITFEITETLLIDDYSEVLNNVEKLQSRGFQVSIDDFGSGYTSFAYLQKLPANELKIDKSYTDSYLESSSSAILESMIFMAKRLNMRIVVEGIEHQQQVDLFKRLGAERLQGWLLDKPMSISALMDKNLVTT